ncbi:MAG: sialidase family protein [Bacteroidales bacterium]|nr:sialidase family protein [Bacteroidales bacterium]
MRNILLLFAGFALAASAEVIDPQGVVLEHGTLYGQGIIPSCHATTIVELPNGDMLAAYFAGTYEGHPDVCVYMSRRRAGHTEWDRPQLLVSGIRTEWTESAFAYDEPAPDANSDDISDFVKNTRKRKACYNPVLYHAPNGDLVLDYKLGAFVQDWTGWEVRSTDNGYTWSDPRPLQTDPALHQVQLGPIKNKPVLVDCPTAEGGKRILAGSSTETGGDWKFHFELSDDGGRTWQMVYPEKDTLQCIQPSILFVKQEVPVAQPKTKKRSKAKGLPVQTQTVECLKAIGRTRHGRLAQCYSYDGGTTWSEVSLSDMPNNNSGTDALTLRDGRHVLVYNDSNVEGRRSPLSVAISDDAEHWTKVCDLETDDLGEYSYPCVIQASDGRLWVLYTWRRQLPGYAIIDIERMKK